MSAADATYGTPPIVMLDSRPQWASLCAHAHALRSTRREAYARGQTASLLCLEQHPERLEAAGLQVDAAYADLDDTVLNELLALAEGCDWREWRDALLRGEVVNHSEGRAAWHTALRGASASAASLAVQTEQQRLAAFAEQFRAMLDATDAPYHLLHIGIGGSDWGPRLVIDALAEQSHPHLKIRFLSNVDGHDVCRALKGLDPRRTGVIVSSKSFTTVETLENARSVFEWLNASGDANWRERIWAVTANPAAARAAGFAGAQIFRYWDWVGGRYSLWSAVALPAVLALGVPCYEALLAGARAMDAHFAQAPAERNLPLRCALIGIWHRNFLEYGSRCVAPYDARLGVLPSYLQQLEMESNGKTVNQSGQPLAYATAPALWGFPGTDSQHTFFQWLHQGSDIAPVEFILCLHPEHDHRAHHRWLVANCLAQRELLARGHAPALDAAASRQVLHPGGRPSLLTVLPRLDAHHLGALLALAEHKVFLQSVLWGINAFDQPGVDHGKHIARTLVSLLKEANTASASECSGTTAHWLNQFVTHMGDPDPAAS